MRLDPAVVQGLPQGWASDVEVLARTGSVIEAHPDHLVVRTAANPGYRWGNLIVVRPGRGVAAVTWVERFQTAFPTAEHTSIGLSDRPDPSAWKSTGLRIESDEVLVASRPPAARPAPARYHARRLTTEDDWAAAVELELADEAGLDSGDAQDAADARDAGAARDAADWAAATDPLAEYRVFARRRWSARAAASASDEAAFFAAFRGEALVACLGIVCCSDHARYQSVLTDRAHRGRGLAGHLLGIAGAWAADRGAARWVIVVEPGSPAARLYRGVGFAFDSRTWQASGS